MNPEDHKELTARFNELQKLLNVMGYDSPFPSSYSVAIEPKSDEDIIEGLREQLKKEKAKVRKLRKDLKFEKLKTMKVVAMEEKAEKKAIAARPISRLEAVE